MKHRIHRMIEKRLEMMENTQKDCISGCGLGVEVLHRCICRLVESKPLKQKL